MLNNLITWLIFLSSALYLLNFALTFRQKVIFSQTMNEHCNYKPERSLLRTGLLFILHINYNKKDNELITLVVKYFQNVLQKHKRIFLSVCFVLCVCTKKQTKLQTEALLLEWALYSFFKSKFCPVFISWTITKMFSTYLLLWTCIYTLSAFVRKMFGNIIEDGSNVR